MSSSATPGVRSDHATIIPGYGWPLWVVAVPGLWLYRPRIMVIDGRELSIWAADFTRTTTKELLWDGPVADVEFRPVLFLIEARARKASTEFPRCYVDRPGSRRLLRDLQLVTAG